uniref:tRNA (guanine(26)-N(2))-dimethyltransferase n=1 Tax=Caenorhabditis japonica TaxID=281687 RepID=A0A8R1IE19_CAEJA
MTMMEHRGIDKRFHAVDLDPYGTAATFLDSAVQCVADRGILMVTCTDMAVLCGNTPEACYNKYEAVTTRMKCCHEVALRILLRAIDSAANRYTRYIEPLVSISVDFYVRVFVRVHTGARHAKESGTKVGHVLVCSGCHAMEPHRLLRQHEPPQENKYSLPTIRHSLRGPDDRCVHCAHPLHQVGPLYLAPIHSKEFVNSLLERLKKTPEEERLGTHGRLQGVLTMVREELDDVLYYEHDQLANTVKVSVPKAQSVRSAILNAGFNVSGSHCNPRALKTNAPMQLLWDIYRQVAKDTSVDREKRLSKESAGYHILGQPITNTINFSLHAGAIEQAKKENLVRFQCNKGKNWGPRTQAKGSVNSTQAGFQFSSVMDRK